MWTRGTTEAINLVAASWGGANLGPGDEVLVTVSDHYSNLVPWQVASGHAAGERDIASVSTSATIAACDSISWTGSFPNEPGW